MIDGLEVFAVVAMARNRVIGANGSMPWHLPGDLKRFRDETMGCPMIMGRRTLDSIGRLLPGRDTIVLTRAHSVGIAGALVANSPSEALLSATAAARARGARGIAIVGGAEIYALLLPVTDRICLTRVEAEPPGDTRLDSFEQEFHLAEQSTALRGERDSAPYRAETWLRTRPAASADHVFDIPSFLDTNLQGDR
ncbi:dihydrofolate reductase [Aureimonas sp. AU4]|uniref:dihydrofolate reductase n=1 Tax=Aureimonas sp. AU4 TaxID=1638163 RepID=UPI000782A62D|nr:dihydrofolate reductase [Aureimonas sp. AU4]